MRKHHHYFLTLTAVLLFSSLPATAQSISPDSFAGWTAAGRQVSVQPGAGDALSSAVAKEYGFTSGEGRRYMRNGESIQANVYRMTDPSGAYGEYSYLRTADMPHATLAEHSAMTPEHALALEGNLILDVHGTNLPKIEADLKSLAETVGKQAQTGPLPTIQDHLPTDGMIDRSDHYILGPVALNRFFHLTEGDWLGFSHGAEAETAQYKLNGHDVTFLIADYPTPQIAADELRRLQEQFDVNGSKAGGARLFAKRTVTKLSFVSGAGTQAEADILLKQIRSGTQVTWNEPTFQFKEPSIEMMIVGAIVSTGTICLFSLIAGLAFGGFRIAVKRLFPDKVFDRSNHLQVLQLGLSSKPIDAEDFYGISGVPAPKAKIPKGMTERTALRLFP
jgi:hypothetical protein